MCSYVCSFCKSSYHTITSCDDPYLSIAYECLQVIYLQSANDKSVFIETVDDHFNKSICCGLAMHYAKARAKMNKQECLTVLWAHFHKLQP